MIVTLTGAYQNVGDHLIGYRAHKLIRQFVDQDIVNIDRKDVTESHYDLFNKARAVLLCGGPAYQKDMFPRIFSLDLTRITSPVVPFGLGYKTKLNAQNFSFNSVSLKFVKEVHSRIDTSSARDVKTVEALNQSGIQNVTMTGCPAWYDLEKIGVGYTPLKGIKSVAFSAPAHIDENTIRALKIVSKRFPKAKKFITFHHGIYLGNSRGQLKLTLSNLRSLLAGVLEGYEVVTLQKDLRKMCDLYDSCDLHVGYRVHAHLYKLSQRQPSILLSEDTRGLSQSLSLGLRPILKTDPQFETLLKEELETVFELDNYSDAFGIMDRTFGVMKDFLHNMPEKQS
jgi:hypothetical protein